jgi:phage recombination protein Bet
MPKKKTEKKKTELAPTPITREISVFDKFTAEEIDVLKNQVGKGLNDAELKVFLMTAVRLKADPFKREMYAQVYTDSRTGARTLTLITGIDFFRKVATTNPRFNGMTPVEYGELVTKLVHGTSVKVPDFARIGVYLKGSEHPTYGEAYFDEYLPAAQNKQFMWKKMPRLMISKCAEALAIRRSFPQKLGNVYTEEEQQVMDEKVITIERADKKLTEEIRLLAKAKGYPEVKICQKYGVENFEDLDQKSAERILTGLNSAPNLTQEGRKGKRRPEPCVKVEKGADGNPAKPGNVREGEIVEEKPKKGMGMYGDEIGDDEIPK